MKNKHYNSGKNNPNYGNPKHLFGKYTSQWKGGKPKCIDCKVEVKDYRSKRCLKCSGKAHGKWMKIKFINPKNHPRYIHGRGNEDYPIEFTDTLKEEIRIRDDYKCKKCGTKRNIVANKEEKMHVHHIDYNKQNCKKENLICLCNKCNLKVNTNRDYWYAFFTYIMEDLI